MNDPRPNSPRRSTKWPLLTFAALLGAGAVAYVVAKRRQGHRVQGVDDLIDVCERFTDALERRMNGNVTSLAG
jgi:hypothetical protein